MTIDASGGVVPQWDLADRMRKALRCADVSVQEMADYLEVGRNTVGRYINGHTDPPGAVVRLWALRCGVPYQWLRHGVVPGPERPRQDSNLQPTVVRLRPAAVPAA